LLSRGVNAQQRGGKFLPHLGGKETEGSNEEERIENDWLTSIVFASDVDFTTGSLHDNEHAGHRSRENV
jgi:hypothetical protein